MLGNDTDLSWVPGHGDLEYIGKSHFGFVMEFRKESLMSCCILQNGNLMVMGNLFPVGIRLRIRVYCEE